MLQNAKSHRMPGIAQTTHAKKTPKQGQETRQEITPHRALLKTESTRSPVIVGLQRVEIELNALVLADLAASPVRTQTQINIRDKMHHTDNRKQQNLLG